MRRLVLLLVAMALSLLVASGVALAVIKIGTDGPDTIMGTKGSDTLIGKGGSDWIDGRGGKDVIRGGPGSDTPGSGPVGMLDGGPGADVIWGGTGSDMMSDGPWPGDSAVDTFRGGDGNDDLLTYNRPATRDIVNCGAGSRDRAEVDRKDVVRDNCEKVGMH